MTPLVLLAILVLGPAALAVLFRVSASMLFMSLCVGELLVLNISNDTVAFVTSTSAHASNFSHSTIELGLLLTPVVLTMIFMFHSLRGSKALINILPALGFGLMSALLVEPLLSPGFQKTLSHAAAWHQILQARTLIVAMSALIALLFLWFSHRGSGSSAPSHRAKHH
jgi:hypothetical protein